MPEVLENSPPQAPFKTPTLGVANAGADNPKVNGDGIEVVPPKNPPPVN